MKRKQKVVIMGANSFIGKNLVSDFFQENNFEIFALDIAFSDGFWSKLEKHSSIHKFIMNFFEPHTYQIPMIWDNADHVFCLISTSKPATYDSRPQKEIFTNVFAYAKLFEYFQEVFYGHVIFISSGGTVYGQVENQIPIKENTLCNPLSAYGMGKRAIELVLASIARKSHFDYTVLRLSNPLGRWQELRLEQGLLPALIQAAINDQPFTIYGEGDTIRDYFDIQCLSDGMKKLISKPEAWNDIYNVGSGKGYSVLDMVKIVEDVMNLKIVLNFLPIRPFDVQYNVLDASKIEKAIGWRPERKIIEAVKSVYSQYHKNDV